MSNQPQPISITTDLGTNVIRKGYLRPGLQLLLKSKLELRKSNFKYIKAKQVKKYYGRKVLYVKKETAAQENKLLHYIKDIKNLTIKHQRAVWGDSDDDYYDEEPKKNFLSKKYYIEYEGTRFTGRRVILGQDIKIETIQKLKFLQKMVSYCQQKLKLEKLKTLGLLRYAINMKKLKLSIKNPDPTSLSKVSLRSESFRSLKSLDFQFELDCSSKHGGWKTKENMPLQHVLECISKSKSLTSASFDFKFVRFANPDVLKNIGLWLDKTRERSFYVNVELEAIDYSLSIVPLIEFKPIFKHCDLLRLFIRNVREANRYGKDYDNNPLDEVPWIGPGDSIGSFEKKRRIVLTIFKDDNTPEEKNTREDFREILAYCENLKSLIFYAGVTLFKWGKNEEYKMEEKSKHSLKKACKEMEDEEEEEENEEDYEDVDEDEDEEEEENDQDYDDEEDEDEEDDEENEGEKADEKAPKLSKIEAEEKAAKCLQGLEEIVIACATITNDPAEENMLMKFFEHMKKSNLVPADMAFPEHVLQKNKDKKLPEFLTHFLGKINENSCSLKYLRLCHSYFDLDCATMKCKEGYGRQDQQEFITTDLLVDKDWNFESVETIELFPGKNDDYDKLKSMLVQMKNLKKLVINARPFYRDQNLTIEEVEGHVKEIRKSLPNLNIKIVDKI